MLAEWAAIAIDNARLYSALEERRAPARAGGRPPRGDHRDRPRGGRRDQPRPRPRDDREAGAGAGRGALGGDPAGGPRRAARWRPPPASSTRDVRGERLTIGWTTWGGVLRGLRPERVADVHARLGISPARARDRGQGGAAGAAQLPRQRAGRDRRLRPARAGGPEFDDEDERLLDAFAASAATAVSTAKSVAEDRLRHSIDASERERQRWARELHDDTLQALGAMRVVLSSAVRTGSADELAGRRRGTPWSSSARASPRCAA